MLHWNYNNLVHMVLALGLALEIACPGPKACTRPLSARSGRPPSDRVARAVPPLLQMSPWQLEVNIRDTLTRKLIFLFILHTHCLIKRTLSTIRVSLTIPINNSWPPAPEQIHNQHTHTMAKAKTLDLSFVKLAAAYDDLLLTSSPRRQCGA